MTTPMFEQYNRLKAANPAALLFFRMGDFYELFFDDAKVASKVLDLTLTARNKADPNPIPMAGVPHHAAGGYIQRLIEAGHRVAIAEQVEDPALAKGLVRREVVRVVTPGVVLDPTRLDQRTPNFLAAVSSDGTRFGVAMLDCSTGDFRCTTVDSADAAGAELARLEPREILYQSESLEKTLKRWVRGVVTSPPVPDSFDEQPSRAALHRVLGHFPPPLDGPGAAAAGAALTYGLAVSGGELGNVSDIDVYHAAGFMVLDDTTRRNLELVRTIRGGRRKGSLLHLLDETSTAMGARTLRNWVAFPLLDVKRIRGRQQGVHALLEDTGLREHLRGTLGQVSDVERIAARVTQGTAHARDLANLRRALDALPTVVDLCASSPHLAMHCPSDLATDVRADLHRWLVADPPQSLTEGGLVPQGAHEELDRLTQLSLDGVSILAELEQRERELSQIPTVKLKKNKVFGYFLEVTRAHLHRVPERWMRKQTLTNCERFITPELKELEEQVLGADEKRKRLELELFAALRERVGQQVTRLGVIARKVATIDALTALGEVASVRNWCCPELDESHDLEIDAGIHPVVAEHMEEARFVPNDLRFDGNRQLIVLTGPNMAGKSTVMRQCALIALLAQIGSFVPARRARIGIVDRIFTRVGASDDVSSGQSTFMVEMAETAVILHEATPRSLVLLDEIGRGTSTYDGLAIAWAVAEHIADTSCCRAIFATHYHELCELAGTRPQVVNQSVAVSEHGEEIIFLRRLRDGGASRSYGVQCARLAGLPSSVLVRARSLLTRFEKQALRNDHDQLSLFGTVRPEEVPDAPESRADPLRDALGTIDPDALSPRDALQALYRLKSLSEASRG